MVRKNYFEIIEGMGFDCKLEIEILESMLLKRLSIRFANESFDSIFSKIYPKLPRKMRGNFTSYNDVKSYLRQELSDIEYLYSVSELILCLFWHLSETNKDSLKKNTGLYIYFDAWETLEEEFEEIMSHISYFLENTNHEIKNVNGRQIIVEKNVYASEVSQIISANNIQEAIKILEYNHFANKGNLSRKREILKSLADYLEPLRKELNADAKLPEVLRSQNKKIIAIEKLFEMYNNLGVRHNNDKQYSREFSEQEMEQWYDDIYTSTLFVILSLEESRILSNLDELKNSQA